MGFDSFVASPEEVKAEEWVECLELLERLAAVAGSESATAGAGGELPVRIVNDVEGDGAEDGLKKR